MKTIPLPQKEQRSMLSTAIDSSLLRLVKEQAQASGLTLRQVVEYGLRVFLEAQSRSDSNELASLKKHSKD